MSRFLFGVFLNLCIASVIVGYISDHYRLWDRQVPAPASLAVVVFLAIMLLRAKIQLWLHKRAASRFLGR